MPVPNNGSGQPGSPIAGPTINPNNPGAGVGQPVVPQGASAADVVPKAVYDQLESKFGSQGMELGEYRSFFKNIEPLLDKLEKAPELVQAIIDGKITGDLAKAVYEGKVQVGDAQAVQQAAQAVQGNPENQGKTTPEIEALIEQKARELRKEFEEKTELQSFEQSTQKFIEGTPDFADYADKVSAWLDSHDITDIRIAYYAVKGELSEAAAKRTAEAAAGEAARGIVANAGGGNSPAQYANDGTPLVDRLIASRPNANVFGM